VSRLLEDVYLRVPKCEWVGTGMRYICTESVGCWDVNERVAVSSSQLVNRDVNRDSGIVRLE